MTSWQKEWLDKRPEELVQDGDMYIQRKNIQLIPADGDKPEHFECEIRFITVTEYNMLQAMQNIMQGLREV